MTASRLLAIAALLSLPCAASTASHNPLALPEPGFHELKILSPTMLELTLVTTKTSNTNPITIWNFVPEQAPSNIPAPAAFTVSANGNNIPVTRVGFKRRAIYAPLKQRDLRIGNYLYLQLAAPVTGDIEVKERPGAAILQNKQWRATADPLRHSPVIHANQVGYLPGQNKRAYIGYYLGSLGELELTFAKQFALISTATGQTNFQGQLRPRPEQGFTFPCYQHVYEADFSEYNEPGQYRLLVPGLGASYPFHIGENVAGWFARTYALGLYHQRCGTDNTLPFTRFTRTPCHTQPAHVPDLTFTNAQWYINNSSEDFANTPRHTARQLKNTDASLYPYVRRGKVDVSGGHHDAGDYSKYTINSCLLVHLLMTAVDSFSGVAQLDNLGLPESGDGKSDLLQEAKWEADFLAKMQDDDGGFYFLVYPRDRRYENTVPPEQGDTQIVWPKTTSVSAAATAALAQCASSPWMKEQFPDAAKTYLAKALKGWQFLQTAIAKHGEDGAYQKLTHYGHEFLHDDELAWAACELYLATGDDTFHKQLTRTLNPADPKTHKWGWLKMYEGYGNAIRSYALAKKAGKPNSSRNPNPPGGLDRDLVTRCETEILAWADQLLKWSSQSAYGTSFPEPTKRVRSAGWYFSCDPAFDLALACQLDHPEKKDPRPKYIDAILANLGYEAGANPVNISYITGLGWKRQREIVHQWALNDHRVLPMPGIPLGNIQGGFGWLDHYKQELGALTYPPDAPKEGGPHANDPYPFYDRWGDSFNLSQEFVVNNQARGIAAWAWIFAQTSLKTQPSKPVALRITTTASGQGAVAHLSAENELKPARILWEAAGHEPIIATELNLNTPAPNWIEAEVLLPDGRLAFAATNTANTGPRTAQKNRR